MPRRFWSISGRSVAIESVAERRLQMLDDAVELRDMASPLEGSVGGSCGGQYSIRINRQWRICVVWADAGPDCVEIVDYL